MERQPVSKRRRFDVFKRDLFTCQYCGRTPPAVVLEVDHIIPVVGGGSSDDHNLITACFDCNRGKGIGSLDAAPLDLKEKAQLLAERLEQVKAYEAVLADKRQREDGAIEAVILIYENAFEGWTLLDSARPSIRRFLDLLPRQTVLGAMELACARMHKNKAFRYFCGVCWKRINGERDDQP